MNLLVQEGGMVMFVGLGRHGVLIELGGLERFEIRAIAHAMRPAREKYLRWKG